jgi:hypothetical protein
MKKAIKIVIGVVVVVAVLLIGVIVTLPLTIAPLVKSAAAAGGPRVLGVDIAVGDVKLRPFAGQLTISDLKVGNPKGYAERDSFAVKTVDVQLKTGSLLRGDTIHIKKILIDSPEILYEVRDGKSNFDTMLEMVKSAEEDEKTKDKKEGTEDKPKKKVVIEEFVLQGSKVAYASKLTFSKPVTVPLPTVKVNGIGEKSGGVSGVEAISDIIAATVGGLKDAIAGVVGKTAELGTDALKKGGEAAKDAAEGAHQAAQDAAEGAQKAAQDAAEGAQKAAKEAAGKLKGLFGK